MASLPVTIRFQPVVPVSRQPRPCSHLNAQHRLRPLSAHRQDADQSSQGQTQRGFLPLHPYAPASLEDIDDGKEISRRYRRTVFTFEDWAAHRSANRYKRHLDGLFTSRIVWGLSRPLLTVVGISLLLTAYHAFYEAHALPPGWPALALNTGDAFNQTSFALSLLLVFRTNTSYSRWEEARKAWGSLANRARDFARQGLCWFPQGSTASRKMLVRWTIAFARASKAHVRTDSDLAAELQDILDGHELEQLLASEHRPNYALQVLSELVYASTSSEGHMMCMDQNLTAFADCLGTCERLVKTPIPLSYTRHTSRILVIWVTILPFTLWDQCRWLTTPAAAVIAFLLLGIEEIGVSIEEPCSILALDNICDTIESGLKEMDAKKAEVQKSVTGKIRPANELIGYGLANGPQERQLSVQQIKETVNSVS